MGKTRRKLYGRSRRRQRGGVCRSKLLLAAAAAGLSMASAEDAVPLRQLVKNYLEEGSWAASKALADRLVEAPYHVLDYFPTFSLESVKSDESCETAAPSDLTEGATYTITGTLPQDIGSGSRVVFKRSYTIIDDDDGKAVTTTMYEVQRESDVNDPATSDRTYEVSGDEVTLTPVKEGGKRRKTLRRKK